VELESTIFEIAIKSNRFTFFFPVDKVVIDQESFGHFINTICPGAYSSMTKISFNNLDKLRLRPTGVYGSKAEIVKLLRSLGTVDDKLFVLIFIYGRSKPDRCRHLEPKVSAKKRTPV
jgi:hypothetical protein